MLVYRRSVDASARGAFEALGFSEEEMVRLCAHDYSRATMVKLYRQAQAKEITPEPTYK